ncbi:MAG: methyltransferase domain-containing protein [Spirochaetaceae bacterium]|nr:methyltransferase domain-containing protein [Spirochaetaceae bacterium]
MLAIIVQSRLGSTRLPNKALLPIQGKPIIQWVLSTMKQVPADAYYLATDENSYETLEPLAKELQWNCFLGHPTNVLSRYCSLIKKIGCNIVVRATGDNPFLFYEAAQYLIEQFKNSTADYMTLKGLPHGSGVEIFKADSLLKASTLTNHLYDHEHVGPALYNYPETFSCVFLEAPEEWRYPKLRTTVDTFGDYQRAKRLARNVKGEKPFSAKDIIEAALKPEVQHPLLFIPSVKKGQGTGHLLRCVHLAENLKSDIYIPADADEDFTIDWKDFCKKVSVRQVLSQKDEYETIIVDGFHTDKKLARAISPMASVVMLDEGSSLRREADFVLDVIPSLSQKEDANEINPAYITLPKNRKQTKSSSLRKILVCVGGEDPKNLTLFATKAVMGNGREITSVFSKFDNLSSKTKDFYTRNGVTFVSRIENLREKIADYDVVVTHYGFTAFEAIAAGCGVILLETSPLHKKIAQKYGFVTLPFSNKRKAQKRIEAIFSHKDLLYTKHPKMLSLISGETQSLEDYVRQLSYGKKYSCPHCGEDFSYKKDALVSRDSFKTIRRCKICGLDYISWGLSSEINYGSEYFFSDYKKQYGKTYLEDFDTIKKEGERRLSYIEPLCKKQTNKDLLDIGCAYGPFLQAAKEKGFKAFGIDVSEEAVRYVENTLKIPCKNSAFPNDRLVELTQVEKFSVITMWYVIEHFKDLKKVLCSVYESLDDNGIFAFSTPNASGVSGKYSKKHFYTASPKDHFSIFSPKVIKQILKKNGFAVEKIVITGHHPERFPFLKKHNFDYNKKRYALLWQFFTKMSHIFKLGDTFEVYARKVKK